MMRTRHTRLPAPSPVSGSPTMSAPCNARQLTGHLLAGVIYKAMAEAIPDSLVDEIGIACTPDEAPDRLAQWADLTDEPLFYAPSIGVRPEAMRENLDTILDVFAKSA